MKIFITGGSGLLGQYLNLELSKKHNILTQYQNNIGNCKDYNSVQLSITDQTKLTEIFTSFKPDVVVHTAAVSNPEKSDSLSADVVYNINVNATKKLAELCEKNNSKLIYLSTDLVYAGYRGSMLKEDAKLIPLSLYAETKLMGEIKIQETFNNYLILRESNPYGPYHNSDKQGFINVILKTILSEIYSFQKPQSFSGISVQFRLRAVLTEEDILKLPLIRQYALMEKVLI